MKPIVMWLRVTNAGLYIFVSQLTVLFQDAQDLAACDAIDLGNAVRVSQHDTNLRRGGALLGKLAD